MSVHRCTLRFFENVAEEGFVRSRATTLAANMFWCCVPVVFTTVLSCLGLAFEISNAHLQPAQAKMRWIRLVLNSCISVSGALGMIITRSQRCLLSFSFEKRELVFVVLFICWVCGAVLNSSYYGSKIMGYDPFAIYDGRDCFNDTRTLLAFDAIITASHICLPIRWCFLVTLDALVMFICTVLCFGVEGPDQFQASIISWMFICSLILLASFGKRELERVERNVFVMLADEKTRRVGLEFRLSNVEGEPRGSKPHDESSVPSTTVTGKLFDLNCEAEGDGTGAELATRLDKLLELGSRQQWLIDTREVALSPSIIGMGGFGFVVVGEFYGTKVAVKIPIGAPRCDALSNELRIMRHIRHQNVVAFHGACVEPEHGRLALVMEFVQGTPLDDFVCKKAAPPGLREQQQLLKGICSALCYLHARKPPVIHGDVSASNVLVETAVNHICPKLLDFGLSRKMTKNAKRMGGTLRYKAPEIISGPAFSSMAADVFSFGRILFVVTSGTRPLQGLTRQAIIELSCRGPPRLNWPPRAKYSVQWEIAEKCMQSDPRDRPHIADVFAGLTQDPGQESQMCNVSRGEPWDFDWGTAYPRLQSLAEAKSKRRKQREEPRVLPKIHEESQQRVQTNNNCADSDSTYESDDEHDETALPTSDDLALADQDASHAPNELDLVDVSVEFDAFDPSYTLLECTLKFRPREGTSLHSGIGLECASLKDLVPPNILGHITGASQDVVNAFFCDDESPPTEIGAVPMNVPPNLNSGATCTLYAGSCRLDLLHVTDSDTASVGLTWRTLGRTRHWSAGNSISL